ncbi:MAG: alpha-amylase family glycosyl hydrolase [Luteibaculaceae bacterium]
MYLKNLVALALLSMGLVACNNNQQPAENLTEWQALQAPPTPSWAKNATLYELNVRQYSPEGTFNQVTQDLHRLKELGVDIIWLMPIHPIGELNRKGSMGSYYAVKDYKGLNPEFGSAEDFRRLVEEIHNHDMKVIIDWVANHSAPDNPWVTSNPEWYFFDSLGVVQPPAGTDWFDTADLNYEVEAVHDAMIDAMAYWVKEFDIDGFRCDVASYVPTAFWNRARNELEQIKNIFMLAEAEHPDQHEIAFDACYGWEFLHIMNGISTGEKALDSIDTYLERSYKRFPAHTNKMYFTTNHDENSWNGTVHERYGKSHMAYFALAATVNGMPLIYSGQEVGMDKALRFFEKDTIDWNLRPELAPEYAAFMHLRRNHPAMANHPFGAKPQRLQTSANDKVYAFTRELNGEGVLVLVNLFDKDAKFSADFGFGKDFTDFRTNAVEAFGSTVTLPKHSYRVFTYKTTN